jgi:hypothetical protein
MANNHAKEKFLAIANKLFKTKPVTNKRKQKIVAALKSKGKQK